MIIVIRLLIFLMQVHLGILRKTSGTLKIFKDFMSFFVAYIII